MMNTSMNTSYLYCYARTRQYGGATLLFVLIMLLVVSIIGVSSVKTTIIQEKMASNTNVRNITFEAAESALAAGEIRIANTPKIWETAGAAAGECEDAVCGRNTSISPIWMSTPNFWENKNYMLKDSLEAIESGPIKVEPKYIIEDLGQSMAACDPNHIDITKTTDCPYTSAQRYFRVVGYAKAYSTEVMLQSTYLDPNPTRDPTKAASEWSAKDPECNGETYSPPGQKCCPPDGKNAGKNGGDWVSKTGKCPSYCDSTSKGKEEYDPDTQQCCDPNPKNVRQVISKSETCPTYCGNNVIDESKEVCCNVQGAWSVLPGTDSFKDCPQFCGNDPRGKDQVCCWKGSEQYSYTANSTSDCPKFCDIGGGTLAPVNSGQKCCPNASGTGYEVINGECPNYCNGKVLQAGQTCCTIPSLAGGGQLVVNGSSANCPKFCGPNEIKPGQECCGRADLATAKIYDPTANKCCVGSNNATKIIGLNEFCCTDQYGNQVANPTQNCPVYCGSGQNAIRYDPPDEQCCRTGTNPIKASSTEMCCSNVAVPKTASGRCLETCNGQTYDPGIQSCCYDWDANGGSREKAPAAPGETCPMYCRAPGSAGHNKLLPPGETCCTVKDADNYGEIAQCIGGSSSSAGS